MTTADGSVLGTTQIFGGAPRNRAFNVVLLAEGFTAAQQNDFNTACTSFVTAFRATPPFDELAPAINVFRVNVTSTDSGADDPGRAAARARPRAPTSTRASAATTSAGCWSATPPRRCRWPRRRCPNSRPSLVVVNSTIYGGSGGAVGTYSLADGATEIAIHEMGHTAFGLADEYPYYAGGNETGHDHHPAGEPAEPNVTTNTDRNTLKWRWAVAVDDRDPDDEQSRLPHGGQPAEPGADRHGRAVRRRALLSLRRFPARIRLQDARARACRSAASAGR